MKNRKNIFLIILIVIVALVIGFIIGNNFKFKNNDNNEEGKGCTLEAKICPDGSAVGRTGPNCEFAPCP